VYIENGGARHVYYIVPEKIPAVIRDSLVAQALGVLTPALGKMSVAAVMVRLLGRSTSVWKWQLWGLYIIMAIYMVMSILVVVFVFAQCSPTAALWDTTITNAHCWKKSIYVDYCIAQSCESRILPRKQPRRASC
jgi:magnesium-transporting ATPase (P-type)